MVEKNSTLLRLGLHLEFNDARHRVAAHLQRNIDRSEYKASHVIYLSLSIKKILSKSSRLESYAIQIYDFGIL